MNAINPYSYDSFGILNPVTIHNPLELQTGVFQGASASGNLSLNVQNPVQQALDQLNPVRQIEAYLQENQINYIVGFIGIVLLIVGIGALAKPAIETAAKVAV